MRKLVTTLLGLGALSAAHAAPITFTLTDVVNPSDFKMAKNGLNEEYSFTHSILDDGFAPATDHITGAQLVITLSDDGDQAAENVRVILDNIVVGQSMQVTSSNFAFQVNTQMLQTDGQLVVTLKALAGDFWFQQSQLDVSGTGPEAVPEPGSVALMGLGLLGLGAAWRRKGRKK